VCSIWHTSQVKTIEHARAREVPFASAGASSTLHRSALLVNAIAGTRFKPVAGFDGGTALLALERGEVEGICNQLASQRTTRPQWLKEGKLKPIVFVAMTVDPEFAGVPRAYDLARDEAGRQILELYLLPWEFNHSFMLPPGAPPSALAMWRAAFDKAVKNPAYLADAAKRLQKIAARSGTEVQGLVDKLYATPKEIVARTIAATSAKK
jgi:tripartite-type tricarboxylate transporter receptor subunit TctC